MCGLFHSSLVVFWLRDQKACKRFNIAMLKHGHDRRKNDHACHQG